jgi:aspartyl-tRNA(Asn)/glutamyl-tRNA(Gln) amidotransferase subunit C
MKQPEKLTEKDVAHVAALASLELTAEERDRMLRDLNQILQHIDQLNELNTDGVPPMASTAAAVASSAQQSGAAWRADEARPSLPHEEAMRNAPDADGTYFRVRKVIER